VLNDLIPVLDDLDRSLEAISQNKDNVEKVIEGIRLIQKRLYDTLANKYGLTKFNAQGEVFDPNLHEAMYSEIGDVPESMVTQEFMPGYKLHDRVIRTAKVKVMLPMATQTGEAQHQESQG